MISRAQILTKPWIILVQLLFVSPTASPFASISAAIFVARFYRTHLFFFYYYYHGLLRFVCICFLISNFLRLFVWLRQTTKYRKIFLKIKIKRNNAEKWRPHMAAWKIRDSMLENNEAPMTNWRFRRNYSVEFTLLSYTLFFINFNIIISICFAAVIILKKPFLYIFCSRVNNF